MTYKKTILGISVLFLIILFIFVSGCTDIDRRISVDILTEEPEVYFELSQEDLLDYPKLEAAIQDESWIEINYDEQQELLDFFEGKTTRNFYYNNSYYKARFASAS